MGWQHSQTSKLNIKMSLEKDKKKDIEKTKDRKKDGKKERKLSWSWRGNFFVIILTFWTVSQFQIAAPTFHKFWISNILNFNRFQSVVVFAVTVFVLLLVFFYYGKTKMYSCLILWMRSTKLIDKHYFLQTSHIVLQ